MNRKLLLLLICLLILAGGAQAQSTTQTKSTAATSDKPKRPPIFRPNKDQIKQVQTILKDKKLYSGEPSGKYDDDTRAGIRSFQKSNGLRETGTLNRATLEKFGVELTDKQKEIPVTASSTTPGSTTPKRSKTDSSAKSGPSASGSDDKPKRTIFRANKEQITAAQAILRSKSMLTGEEAGKLDDPTRDGLRKYQGANGLKVTGTLNAATLEKMGIALTDKQKETASN